MSVRSEYDDFAGDYDWIYSDRALTGEPFYEGLMPLFDRLPPDPRILDCACGTGIAALEDVDTHKRCEAKSGCPRSL